MEWEKCVFGTVCVFIRLENALTYGMGRVWGFTQKGDNLAVACDEGAVVFKVLNYKTFWPEIEIIFTNLTVLYKCVYKV